MRSTLQQIQDNLNRHFADIAPDEDVEANHEFIANFIGLDDVLRPAYDELVKMGCTGEPPSGGGWIYMHISRPLTREAVLQLACQFDDVASRTGCLFELLDVRLNSSTVRGRSLLVLGALGGQARHIA